MSGERTGIVAVIVGLIREEADKFNEASLVPNTSEELKKERLLVYRQLRRVANLVERVMK